MIFEFFTYFPFVAFALTMFAFVVPGCRALGLGTRAQAVWAMFLLFCFSKFFCYRMFGGHVFNPNLPMRVIWAWNFLYSGAMILFALSVAAMFFRFRAKMIVLPAVAWLLSAWGVWNGVKTPAVREVEMRCEGLPDSLDGYRIVQIADIHVSSAAPRWRTEAIVGKANAANADLVVCTGDIVDGEVSRRRRDVEPIKDLKAKDGVYFVTGNHEYYNEWDDWKDAFDRWGIRFLRNECVFPRAGLALGGVDDEAIFRWRENATIPDVRGAFAAATNGEFRVLLQHRPLYFAENAQLCGVDLQLSGHTHGGVLPGLDMLVSLANGGFVRGAYESGPSRLYVSPGCGQWAGFPVRFFDDPEISVIVLRKPNI